MLVISSLCRAAQANDFEVAGDLIYTHTSGVSVSTFTTVKGNSRILVSKYDHVSSCVLSVYEHNNPAVPLASNDISFTGLKSVRSVVNYGDNIIVGGIGSNAVLLELNPDTLEVVKTYPYPDTNVSGEKIMSDVMVNHNGVVYASFVMSGNTSQNSLNHLAAINPDGTMQGPVRLQHFDLLRNRVQVSAEHLYFFVGNTGRDDIEQFAGIYRYDEPDLAALGMILSNIDNLFISPDLIPVVSGMLDAYRVIDGRVHSICPDGRGGLFYTTFGDNNKGEYIYHWDGIIGSTPEMVFDAGDMLSFASPLKYSLKNNMLYVLIDDLLDEYLCVLRENSNGKFDIDVAGNFGHVAELGGFAVANELLPAAIIEPAGHLDTNTRLNLAQLMKVDTSDLRMLAWESIGVPLEPTRTMSMDMRKDNYQAIYKLNTLTVSEDGYYVLRVNVPEELQGMSIGNFRLYTLTDTGVSRSSINASLINNILNYVEITNLLGVKIDTLEKQALAVGVLQAGTPFSVYLAKLLAFLASGCDSGLGFVALCVLGLVVLKLRK